MAILPYPPAAGHRPSLHLTIEFRELDPGTAARLMVPTDDDPDPRWFTLALAEDLDEEAWCRAGARALRQVLTGESDGRWVRHLSLVPALGGAR